MWCDRLALYVCLSLMVSCWANLVSIYRIAHVGNQANLRSDATGEYRWVDSRRPPFSSAHDPEKVNKCRLVGRGAGWFKRRLVRDKSKEHETTDSPIFLSSCLYRIHRANQFPPVCDRLVGKQDHTWVPLRKASKIAVPFLIGDSNSFMT